MSLQTAHNLLAQLFATLSSRTRLLSPVKKDDTYQDLNRYFFDINAPKRTELSEPNKKFNAAFDRLLSIINTYQTEQETVIPENVEKTKAAYRTFLREMHWKLAEHAFDMLLVEKKGRSRSGDSSVPDWYHEFRENLWLLMLARNGALPFDEMHKRSELEVMVAANIRHDSWEDYGHSRDLILMDYRAYIKLLRSLPADDPKHINQQQAEIMDVQAQKIARDVDLVTKKILNMDAETGEIQFKADGVTKDRTKRFRSLEEFHDTSTQSPRAILIRQTDANEGLNTRIPNNKIAELPSTLAELEAKTGDFFASLKDDRKFSLKDNRRYNNNIRRLLGRNAFDDHISALHPSYETAFRTMDDLTGISLVLQESFCDTIDPNAEYSPRNANQNALRIGQYIPRVKKYLPCKPDPGEPEKAWLSPGWSPYCIPLQRLEEIEEKESSIAWERYKRDSEIAGKVTKKISAQFHDSIKTAELLEFAHYPAMEPLIGKRALPSLQRTGAMWGYIQNGDNPSPNL